MNKLFGSALASGAFFASSMLASHEAFASPSQEAPQETTTSTTETTLPQETTTTSTTETTIAPETTTTLEECREDNITLVQQGDSSFWDAVDKDTGKLCSTLIIPGSPRRFQVEIEVLDETTTPKKLARTGNNTGEMVITSGGLIVAGLALVRAKNTKLRKAQLA